MATPESRVKAKVSAILKKHNVYFFYPATGGYGRSGIPDVIACVRGRFVGIECKAGDNNPTALQQRELQRIIDSLGRALVVRETNLDELDLLIKELVNAN
jgi:Holliday junction resolvase